MIDINALMDRAKTMQDDMKRELSEMAIEGSSGGGMVNVVINGNKELTKIEFSPNAAKDSELLADMVLAAMSGAYTEADRRLKERIPNMFNGLNLPGLDSFLK